MKQAIVTGCLFTLCIAVQAAPLSIETPCDLSKIKLDKNFSGHNVHTILSTLNGVKSRKDEFESTAMYQSRLKADIASKPKAIAQGELCHVAIYNRNLSNHRYDADAGILWVDSSLGHSKHINLGNGLTEYYWLYIDERNRRESAYSGSNALGVSTEITKTERDTTYIVFKREQVVELISPSGAEYQNTGTFAIPLTMPPEKAKSTKENIGVVYKYSLTPPIVGQAEDYDFPTLNSPFERHDKETLVASHLVGVVIFNAKTGEILKGIEFCSFC